MRALGIVLLMLWMLIVPSVMAQDVLRGDRCVVEAGTTIDGDLFALCRSLIIDGAVNGNLYGAAAAAQINGTVGGDIYLIGGQSLVNGEVAGSLHFVGAMLQLGSNAQLTDAQGSLLSLSLSTTISPSSVIPGSIAYAGYQLAVDGNVGREVNFWGTSLEINGTIAGNVGAQVGGEGSTGAPELLTLLRILAPDTRLIDPGLVIGENAAIAGTLKYSAPDSAEIMADLAHEPEYTPLAPVVTLPQTAEFPEELAGWVARFAIELLTALIFALLLITLAARTTMQSANKMSEKPAGSLLTGLVAFLLAIPLAIAILILSLILMLVLSSLYLGAMALVVGFVINVLNLGALSLFFFIGVFFARMVAAYVIGRWLTRRIGQSRLTEQRRMLVAMLVGVFSIALLTSLPLIGWLVSTTASVIGTGAVIRHLDSRIRPPKQRPSAALITNTRPTPPPISEDRPLTPGVENLPDGFNWWD